MSDVIYAIKTSELKYQDLEVMEVKIGMTGNIDNVIRGYQRVTNPELLTLWEPNGKLPTSKCETGVHKIAERYAYERKSEKFVFLQDSYERFADNISHILNETTYDNLKENKVSHEKAIDWFNTNLTGTRPKKMEFNTVSFEVNSWKEVLLTFLTQVWSEDTNYKLLNVKGDNRPYFTKEKSKLRNPESIPNTSFYFEANLSSNQIRNVIRSSLKELGYTESDLNVIIEE